MAKSIQQTRMFADFSIIANTKSMDSVPFKDTGLHKGTGGGVGPM
jgi:hypothetical protein